VHDPLRPHRPSDLPVPVHRSGDLHSSRHEHLRHIFLIFGASVHSTVGASEAMNIMIARHSRPSTLLTSPLSGPFSYVPFLRHPSRHSPSRRSCRIRALRCCRLKAVLFIDLPPAWRSWTRRKNRKLLARHGERSRHAPTLPRTRSGENGGRRTTEAKGRHGIGHARTAAAEAILLQPSDRF